ncbi:MFS transporter [Mycobacterium haemophilum]|nr:MFS transporter [Mycobacterium haemophilum]
MTSARIDSANPWYALWAMMTGFFMIVLDSNIVAIANPTIMADLRVGYDTVVWVTSAYLLGYAVVLLVAGRLGDRFGPKNLYLIGLVVFTVASAWCGLSGSAAMLIAARVVQGVGAGVLTPQTLSTITRIFPTQRRGAAMSVWGATAGAASLLGPLAGGALVDGLGWQWIFFVNVPVGIVGLALAVWLVPVLPTQGHRFDLVGVGLSGAGTFLIVFGLQQGQTAHWAPWIWATLVAGVGFLATFVYWQAVNTGEPLIPLNIFGDRDFSLCNVGAAIVAFATMALLPLMFYAQAVCGLSPTRSALLIAPLAITNAVLAPVAGMIIDRYHPRPVLGFGFSMLAIAQTWLSFEMAPGTPIWRLVLPLSAIGAGLAFVWSPLTATATRNLAPQLAGASSAVYNSIRQLGAVLGSAGMAAFMTSRISAELPSIPRGGHAPAGSNALALPDWLRGPFAAAMSESMLLPAFIALFGIIAALFVVGGTASAMSRAVGERPGPVSENGDRDNGYDDDNDDYVELILHREPDIDVTLNAQNESVCDTEPIMVRFQHPQPTPADAWHSDPVESRHSLLADSDSVSSQTEPIGLTRNGTHVDGEQRFRPTPLNRHYRRDPDDPVSYGRHASGR